MRANAEIEKIQSFFAIRLKERKHNNSQMNFELQNGRFSGASFIAVVILTKMCIVEVRMGFIG